MDPILRELYVFRGRLLLICYIVIDAIFAAYLVALINGMKFPPQVYTPAMGAFLMCFTISLIEGRRIYNKSGRFPKSNLFDVIVIVTSLLFPFALSRVFPPTATRQDPFSEAWILSIAI